MNTPLTTAEIVERLTTDSDLLDAWATWELGALPVPGPMNHADIATNLRTAASALLALEGERDEARKANAILDPAAESFHRRMVAAEAELAKVRTALEPFAKCADMLVFAGATTASEIELSGDDLFRALMAARAALAEKTV